MKNRIFALLPLLAAATYLMSFPPQEECVISGRVDNIEADHISIHGQPVGLDKQQFFNYKFPLEKPAYVKVDFGKSFFLYLKPGDAINLQIDAKQGLGSIQLSGDRLQVNRFMIDEALESERTGEEFSSNIRQIVLLDENQYAEKMNALWQPFEQRLERFIGENSVKDKFFIKTQRAILVYSKADILLRYADWHRALSGDPAFQASGLYYDFLKPLDLNDPQLIDIEEYKTFLDRYLTIKAEEILQDGSAFRRLNYRPFRAKMQIALETFTDPQVRDEMLFSFMETFIDEYYHKGIDDLVGIFKKSCSNADYVNIIDRKIAADKTIREAVERRIYKTVDGIPLDVLVYRPPGGLTKNTKRPAIAFFHGGGWECGKPEWGQMQCQHFSSLGLVAFSFEYRLFTQHGATPVDGIADAKSAIRWIRQHADEFGIDPKRIVGSGYSAGGHLVLTTAMIDKFDEPSEDHSISSAVDAMMLWVTPAMLFDGWFTKILQGKAKLEECDPIAFVRADLPPAIMFQGTIDNDVPPWTAKEFANRMTAAGNRCDLHIYEGQTHLGWGENADDVLAKMDAFLRSIGFLDPTEAQAADR